MGSFSIWHWLIVLVIVALIFGTKKIRNIGADLGGAVKGFKEGMKDPNAKEGDHRAGCGMQLADGDFSIGDREAGGVDFRGGETFRCDE